MQSFPLPYWNHELQWRLCIMDNFNFLHNIKNTPSNGIQISSPIYLNKLHLMWVFCCIQCWYINLAIQLCPLQNCLEDWQPHVFSRGATVTSAFSYVLCFLQVEVISTLKNKHPILSESTSFVSSTLCSALLAFDSKFLNVSHPSFYTLDVGILYIQRLFVSRPLLNLRNFCLRFS